MPATALSGLLPVRVSGRHYGENLARLDLLLSSLLHFAPTLLDELVVVARADEIDRIGPYLDHWPELPIRLVVEDEHFPAFRRFTRPWQIRPWQRQQIIKLNAPAMTGAAFVLTLDPDVLALKPITRDLILPGGRALLEPEPRSVHPRWWRDSADLLDVEPELERPGINVTPAVLSAAILRELQERLEAVSGRPWMDMLLTSYCEWTEYTLYLLAAEWASLVDREHLWSDRAGVARPLAHRSRPQHLGRRRRLGCRRPAAVLRGRPRLVRGRAEQQWPHGESGRQRRRTARPRSPDRLGTRVRRCRALGAPGARPCSDSACRAANLPRSPNGAASAPPCCAALRGLNLEHAR